MKHKAPRRIRRRWVVIGAATAAVASTAAVATAMGGDGSASTARPCTGPVRSMQVLAAPEVAPVVTQAARRTVAGLAPDEGCVRIDVVPEVPAAAADAITASPSRRPAAWIPDSSWWTQRLLADGVALGPERPSLAVSPVVLAVSPRLAQQVGAPRSAQGFRALLSAPAGSASLALPDPERDAASALALAGLVQSGDSGAAGRVGLAQLLRGRGDAAASFPQRLAAVAEGGSTTVPASEQAVLAQDRRPGTGRAVALYAPSGASLDYPFLVLSSNAADNRVLSRLQAALEDRATRSQLASLGFRAPDGSAPPAVTGAPELDGALRPAASVDVQRIDAALRVTNLLSEGTRMLAVIDVSGSMGDMVPGTRGLTRLDVTKAAAAQGLSAYTDDSEIGLWVFSRHLSARADYRPLVPIGPLGRRSDGTFGRAQLAQALQNVHEVRDGGTALYATVLAAVRQVRQGWDRGRVNSVVLLTDGRDDGEGGPSLAGLLATLRREADPARPVPVITVGLGGGSDTKALAAISQATGGSSFVSRDGADAFSVLAEAISKRACRPSC